MINKIMRYWANAAFYLMAAFCGYGLASIFSTEFSFFAIHYYLMGIAFVMTSRSLFFTRVSLSKLSHYSFAFMVFLGVMLAITGASFEIVENIKNTIAPNYYYGFVVSIMTLALLILMTSIYYLNKT
ncbi:hypothetical protein [Thiothrix winogradskyi]|uniref:Uncharacterized protein n=1 Tax=Thiothrix winogradskyi TaxID=96472 RepID=A0ABY3SZP3_9GAMM|nr:hypothetical protein [Thiothrix winogradskyi]UJS24709.1 hypothetical protein L2Y54_01350 [Thiothrix winogradskyi]